ncbi:hypothetical protein [Natrinema halophilum]|uniref:Uncharacterized protein n=1 Tax=Natrinema halophilum TaxID=1699371 RepID=A0A7D5GG86_9EURY|nr:hypothetical protein [Natrinema halophilum]QLG48114.1 hypothetical protein HYG82_04255 [Natrinema halophilum]
MIGPRDDAPLQCPDCRAAIDERDPLLDWCLCDDCEVALDADGERIT